jgi:oxygen-independent coproporphyrinogen-3 oxidase
MARAAYVHVPFCAHRCGYCNFALVAGRGDLVPSYLQAVELELQRQLTEPREVDTLYYGGGTPTQLRASGLRTLTQLTSYWHPLATGYEWTVEANPADMSPEVAEVLATAGVNRLSLGAQSFRAEKLRVLERDHTASDIERSVHLAREHGMAVSIDLIFAAPGESLGEWLDDLGRAIELRPQHISVYGLTFEKGTTYWSRRLRGELLQADDELERDMYVAAIDELAAAGFEHYEVSNFAQPECRSRHNETYWRGAEYYAVGPGAARYLAGVRETNHRSTTTYLQRVLAGESAVAEREQLDAESRAREHLVFGLRRLEGLRREEFRQATGFAMDELAGEAIAKFTSYGLLADDGERVRLTRQGLLVSDAMWPEML